MPNLKPISDELRFGMYPKQNKLVNLKTRLVWLIWLSVKSQWPIWLIINHNGHSIWSIWLNLGYFNKPLAFLTKCLVCCIV